MADQDSCAGGVAPDWWDVDEAGGRIGVLRPHETFYGDVDPDTASAAAGRLGRQLLTSFTQPLTEAAWRTIPSSYIVCEQDAAIPVVAQEAMGGRAGRTHLLDASHSPFLSRPDRLAEILRAEAAAGLAG